MHVLYLIYFKNLYMIHKLKLTTEAFRQQLKSWQKVFTRALKLFQSLKKNHTINPKLINKIRIIQTQIACEISKYRKKINCKFNNQNQVISNYNKLSKTFNFIENQISDVKNVIKDKIYSPTQSIVSSSANPSPLSSSKQKNLIQPEKYIKKNQKRYMEDTFNMKITRQLTKATKNTHQYLTYSSQKFESSKYFTNILSPKIKNTLKRQKEQNSKEDIRQNRHIKSEQIDWSQNNIYGLKDDLQILKLKIKKLQNKVDLHEHSEYQKEMNALRKKNRKMEYDIKSFKESNSNLTKDIHQIKTQIKYERELQAHYYQTPSKINLIQKTQKPSDYQVSHWVKSRIQKI